MVTMNIGILLASSYFLAVGKAAKPDDVQFPNPSRDPPIALLHIGYAGTWKSFCDDYETNEDFNFYPAHIMKKLRMEICQLKAEANVTQESIQPFVIYKYCDMKRRFADHFLKNFLSRFSQGDELNEDHLISRGPIDNTTECFQQVLPVFEEKCIAEKNPFHKMFHLLFSRACAANWLKTEQILSEIREICKDGMRMTADIDYDTIRESIYIEKEEDFKEETDY